jgi:endonuclease YncB( thermonuclease family)
MPAIARQHGFSRLLDSRFPDRAFWRHNDTMSHDTRHMGRLSATVLTFLIALVAAAQAEELRGPARVHDGDTLVLAGERLRLAGIDAPETGQTCEWPNKTIPCGEIAIGALMDLTTAAEVVCVAAPRHDGDAERPATCQAGGYDIGRNMIHTGWAVATPDAPDGYRAVQAEAQAKGHGMWKGRFEMPWQWRQAKNTEE